MYIFQLGDNIIDIWKFIAAQKGIQSQFSSQSEAEQRLLENCRKRGLTFHGHTPADGNCFFHAVSDQLSLLGLPHQSPAQLRNNIVSYLSGNQRIQVSIIFDRPEVVYVKVWQNILRH